MLPAFITVMVAKGPPSRQKTTSRRKPVPHHPPKRVRISPLTRKYRADVHHIDESLLVDDSVRNFDSFDHLPANYQSPVRYSRFPTSWPETVSQLTNAVCSASADGCDRIRVDLKIPELAQPPAPTYRLPQKQNSDSVRISRLVQCVNSILYKFLPIQGGRKIISSYFAPNRASIFFNTPQEAQVGENYIDPKVRNFVDINVLGNRTSYNLKSSLALIIAPCNKNGNPSRIEAVERVHYSSWNESKMVVMLNPDLVALTRFTAFDDESRQPCFMSEYVTSYYLDPLAFPTKQATGAILRCFPRKWEMYLLKAHSEMGFRLIGEQKSPPSPEKIECEFSWRIESDA